MPISEINAEDSATKPIGARDEQWRRPPRSTPAVPSAGQGTAAGSSSPHHENGGHQEQHQRKHHKDAGLRLGAVLDHATEHDAVVGGSLARKSAIAFSSCFTTVVASIPGATSACTVTMGSRCRRQIIGGSSSWESCADCPSGTLPPSAPQHQVAQRLELGALARNGPRDDVDEVCAVTQLRDPRNRQNGIDVVGELLRTDAERRRPTWSTST